MIATLHENLEAEGARVAPEPESVEERVARRGKPKRLKIVGLVAAVAGTLVGLEHLGLVELPLALLLGATGAMTLAVLVDWLRPKDEDDDD